MTACQLKLTINNILIAQNVEVRPKQFETFFYAR